MLGILAGSSLARADAGNDFLAAREAWSAGEVRRFELLAAKSPRDSVLPPYVEYWKVARRLEADADVADFLASHPDSWLAEKLRSEWLKELGRREMWPAYVAEFPRLAKPEMIHVCLARRAELASGDRRFLADAIGLWFTGKDLPSPADPHSGPGSPSAAASRATVARAAAAS